MGKPTLNDVGTVCEVYPFFVKLTSRVTEQKII